MSKFEINNTERALGWYLRDLCYRDCNVLDEDLIVGAAKEFNLSPREIELLRSKIYQFNMNMEYQVNDGY
jgi:hypothetical protein